MRRHPYYGGTWNDQASSLYRNWTSFVPRRLWRRRVLLGGGVFIATVAVIAYGLMGGGGHSLPSTANPSAAFPILLDADVAGDARDVWLAVAGEKFHGNSRPVHIRVFRHGRAGPWREIRSPPALLSPDSGLSIAVVNHEPCLSYARPTTLAPYVACLGAAGWRPLSGGALTASLVPNKLEAMNGHLYELARDSVAPRHLVLTWVHGTWVRVGDPIPSGEAIGALGIRADKGRLEPAVATEGAQGRAVRKVWVLKDRRWRTLGSALTGVGFGSQTSGPVVADHRPFLAVSDANKGPRWPFSVYSTTGNSWRPTGGRELNRGPGNAQGDISIAKGTVWALWEQDALRPDGAFSSVIRLARMDLHTGRVLDNRQLAAGVGGGILGRMRVVSALGHAYVVVLAPPRRPGVRPEFLLTRVG